MRIAAANLVSLSLLCAAPAAALSVVALSLEQIVAQSDVIVEGQVIDVKSRRIGRRILTFISMRVDVVVRGALPPPPDGTPSTVVFAVLGGAVDGVTQVVPGTPRPALHARLRVALSKADGPEGARHIIGYSQGLWRLDESTSPPALPLDAAKGRP